MFFYFSLPRDLFRDSTATLIEDKNGILLNARIAEDEQWRFPESQSVPYKFEKALLLFEDKYFYLHNGVNPFSMSRALYQDVKAGKIVSGGSTLSMQVIRLSRKNRNRTIWEKLVEVFLAVRMELTYKKREILALYSSHAPFGGNVVGLEAASWRYFGKNPSGLTWAEAATLAVLPNSPSLIYPGKNQQRLKEKRNSLLLKLYQHKLILPDDYQLAINEPLPGKPYPLPQATPHLTDKAIKDGFKGQRIKTTVDAGLQEIINEIIQRYQEKFSVNKVYNAAALVLEVETGNTLAYVGNTTNTEHPEYGCHVDIITSPRSTGSILKPFLYAAMLSEGELLPNTLVADIPTQLGSFTPENYNYTFDGAVPAKNALSRSLNIPAVKMLQSYGSIKFNYILKKIGLTTLKKPPVHYGLSIILGGAEATLWDLAGTYASMARTLIHYRKFQSRYLAEDFHAPNYLFENKPGTITGTDKTGILSSSSIWLTFNAMNEVSRPDIGTDWQEFSSSAKIAWKTGTSYGSRDAWAIGCNPRYVVAVWVGNADGEGRPGLTGLNNAAPLMFEIFTVLKPQGWFDQPFDDMIEMEVCRESGFKKSSNCNSSYRMWVPKNGAKSSLCPYHQLILLDKSEKWRVNSDCKPLSEIVFKKWFVLPPVMEYYYKAKNPFYITLPPFHSDCISEESNTKSMDMIYPKNFSKIFIPVNIDGKKEKVVFKAAHSIPDMKIFWYLDETFLGHTVYFHQMALAPEAGGHKLTLIDKNGEKITVNFTIIDKK